MAVQEICRMGNPILRKVADKVLPSEIKTPEFSKLLEDMKDSMIHYGGVGIAAPQIGVSKQVCLIQFDDDNERYDDLEEQPLTVYINPVIKILDETTEGFWEGCLSVPGLRGYVERSQKISVDYTNEKGEQVHEEVEGFLAVVIQHELDHLFGKLYVDRITDPKLLSFNEEFDEYIVPSLSGDNF